MSATGEAGTTLVETLAVVAIMALTALIAFPRLERGFLRLSQRQTLSQVAQQLRQARAEARRRDDPVAFAVAADGRSYAAGDGARLTAPTGISLTLASPDGRRIVFYGDGSSPGGQVLVHAGAGAAPVSVAAGSGVVRLETAS